LEEKTGILRVTWRKTATIPFISDFSCFPFDEHKVKIKIELTSPYFKKLTANIRFNVLSHDDPTTLMSFKKSANLLADLYIATNKSEVKFIKPEKKEYKDNTIYYRPALEYNIHLYRRPGYAVLSSLGPLLATNLASLAVLAVPSSYFTDKLTILAILLLALFTFMPSLRTLIPKVPYLTRLEGQFYVVLGIILLVMLETVTSYLVYFPTMIITWVIFSVSVGGTLFHAVYFIACFISAVVAQGRYLTPEKFEEVKRSSGGAAFDKSSWKVLGQANEVVVGYERI